MSALVTWLLKLAALGLMAAVAYLVWDAAELGDTRRRYRKDGE